MMKNCLSAALTICAMGLTSSLFAEELQPPFTVGVGESVLGHTFEAGYRISERFGMRGLYGDGRISINERIEGNTYNGDVRLGGLGLVFDYYPSGNSLRLSAGAVSLDHRLNGATSGNIVVNGTNYTAPLNLNASFDQTVAPMIALGVQTPIRNSRLVFSGDLGLVYTGGATATANDPTNTITRSDIDAELSDINNTLDDLPIAPFLKVGIGFSF